MVNYTRAFKQTRAHPVRMNGNRYEVLAEMPDIGMEPSGSRSFYCTYASSDIADNFSINTKPARMPKNAKTRRAAYSFFGIYIFS